MDVPAPATRRVLHQSQLITRLGEGLAATGRLGEAAMARTLAAVIRFCRTARAMDAREILIVATSAVREAANREEFVARVHHAVGVPVRVVPGEEEAGLALLGALDGLPDLAGAFVLFDIGGGSTEFILARERRLAAAVSLRLGVVPLAERFRTAEPLDARRHAELAAEVRARLGAGLADFPQPDGPELIGTAGTVTTLAALDLALATYDPERVHGHRLTRERIEGLLQRLLPLPAHERTRLGCLEAGRADLIVPGTAICLAVMERFGTTALRVSEHGLREGILIDYLARPAP